MLSFHDFFYFKNKYDIILWVPNQFKKEINLMEKEIGQKHSTLNTIQKTLSAKHIMRYKQTENRKQKK